MFTSAILDQILTNNKAYQTARDVNNPQANGRHKTNWRLAKVINQGLLLVAKKGADGIWSLNVPGGTIETQVVESTDLFNVLIAALEPASDGIAAVATMQAEGYDLAEVLADILDSGNLSDADFMMSLQRTRQGRATDAE